MPKTRNTRADLAQFIDEERAAIVAEWETFARSVAPVAMRMSAVALRDHADEILTAIVLDMRAHQTEEEKAKKSKGRGAAQRMGQVGRLHAELRIEFGFDIGQMVAEYRALRASVLRLWLEVGVDAAGVARFNEAIDEALTEAVDRFTETTQRFRDQSLGILGHDLRNPLGAIVMGAAMLVNAEELSDRSVRIAARMLSSANRMNRMIADLLDLTRTRFGDEIPIRRAKIDLEPVCRQVVSELEGLRAAGALTFVATGDLTGEWDSDRMAQVLSNLIGNAIQHGGQGEPITLVADGTGREVQIEVRNGGPAISEAVLATIFDPMVRHTNEHRSTGLGLGLYIASQVVLAHAGKLTAQSTEADGTRFTVRLPRKAPPRTQTAARPTPDSRRPSEAPKRKPGEAVRVRAGAKPRS